MTVSCHLKLSAAHLDPSVDGPACLLQQCPLKMLFFNTEPVLHTDRILLGRVWEPTFSTHPFSYPWAVAFHLYEALCRCPKVNNWSACRTDGSTGWHTQMALLRGTWWAKVLAGGHMLHWREAWKRTLVWGPLCLWASSYFFFLIFDFVLFPKSNFPFGVNAISYRPC